MTAKPRKPLLANLTWVGVLVFAFPVLYVLSYAPVYRLMYEPTFVETRIPGYSPVEWLIDRTPLRTPLFWWSGVFGVREKTEHASDIREWQRTWPMAPS
jgi:hypothetical protein